MSNKWRTNDTIKHCNQVKQNYSLIKHIVILNLKTKLNMLKPHLKLKNSLNYNKQRVCEIESNQFVR